jgi:hypothetical protein
MAQAVSHQALTSEDRFCAQLSPCEIYGGQSGTGTHLSLSSSVSLSMLFHRDYAHISSGRINNRPVLGSSSETSSYPIDVNNNNMNMVYLRICRISRQSLYLVLIFIIKILS